MAQCLYFDAKITKLGRIDSYNKDENISDKFIENIYDARQILFKSLVAKVVAQLAVDCDDNEMAQWLRTFINKKKQLLEESNQNGMMT
ncbi:4024_t:CDS:2, partial [Cetraspora pellucida]